MLKSRRSTFAVHRLDEKVRYGVSMQCDAGKAPMKAPMKTPKMTRRLVAIGVVASVIVALTVSQASAAPIMRRTFQPPTQITDRPPMPIVTKKIQVNFQVANPLQACGIEYQITETTNYIAVILSYGKWAPCYKNLSVTIDNVTVENGSNIDAIAWSGQGFAVSHYRCFSEYVAFAPVMNLSCTLMKI